jgi:hypothetical protein
MQTKLVIEIRSLEKGVMVLEWILGGERGDATVLLTFLFE